MTFKEWIDGKSGAVIISGTIYHSKYCRIEWIDATSSNLNTSIFRRHAANQEIYPTISTEITPLQRICIVSAQIISTLTLRVTSLDTPIYILGYASLPTRTSEQNLAETWPVHDGVFTGSIHTSADVRIPPGHTILVVTPHPVASSATARDQFAACPVPSSADVRIALDLIMALARTLSGQTLTPTLAKACEWGLASLLGIVAGHRPTKRSAGEAADLIYQQVLLDIQANCWHHDFSICQVAQRHKLNVRTLQKMFQAHGTTPREYITATRLEIAQRALRDPANAGKKICDIAFEAGFSSIATFNRLFHERLGQPPSTIRMSMHALPDGEDGSAKDGEIIPK